MLVIHTFIFEHSGAEDSWGPPRGPRGGPRDEWERTQPTRNLPPSRGDGITSLSLQELIFWEQAPIIERRVSQMSRPNSVQAHEVTRCTRAVMQSWFSAGRACAFSPALHTGNQAMQWGGSVKRASWCSGTISHSPVSWERRLSLLSFQGGASQVFCLLEVRQIFKLRMGLRGGLVNETTPAPKFTRKETEAQLNFSWSRSKAKQEPQPSPLCSSSLPFPHWS